MQDLCITVSQCHAQRNTRNNRSIVLIYSTVNISRFISMQIVGENSTYKGSGTVESRIKLQIKLTHSDCWGFLTVKITIIYHILSACFRLITVRPRHPLSPTPGRASKEISENCWARFFPDRTTTTFLSPNYANSVKQWKDFVKRSSIFCLHYNHLWNRWQCSTGWHDDTSSFWYHLSPPKSVFKYADYARNIRYRGFYRFCSYVLLKLAYSGRVAAMQYNRSEFLPHSALNYKFV